MLSILTVNDLLTYKIAQGWAVTDLVNFLWNLRYIIINVFRSLPMVTKISRSQVVLPTDNTFSVQSLSHSMQVRFSSLPIATYNFMLTKIAGSPQGAQFYVSTQIDTILNMTRTDNLQMECAQINVTGGSGTANPATVSFPGAYGVICFPFFSS